MRVVSAGQSVAEAAPRFVSPIPDDVDISAAEVGARLLGLELLPQGVREAQLLEARNAEGGASFSSVVIQMPRRSTKTTAIWATILGRAATREGYRCVVTAQSGYIASRILLEHAERMLRAGNLVESREVRFQDGVDKPVLFRSGGRERIDFPNGSRVWVVPPDPGSVRSAAADDIVIDEAGEFEGDKGEQFMLGVLPLMDTRGPLAQLVVAGTPGRTRSGMFWGMLEDARRGDDDELGILDYSAADSDDPEDRAVWARVHPGPSSGLTPMKVLERRFAKLGAVGFAREYLCMWPADASTSAIDMESWANAEVERTALPDRFGLALDIAVDGSSAALVAAWRDADGVAYVEVVEHRMGVSWLAAKAHAMGKKYRVPVRYDDIGNNRNVAEEIDRRRGVRLAKGNLKDVAGAAQRLVSDLAEGRLRHFGQASLTAAAEGAAWRQTEGARAFGRNTSRHPIEPLVAASLAIWQYDQQPARPRVVSSYAS
ncbi:hypothetical protein [Xylanimonas ulmi]|uniref:hypothetical protein n=1 Tax=Xylanimonas ulmi TaxID=228973 RepID=UPI00102BEB20|nr:hypothetical protein [Xylanibacterium ulmi]